MASIFLYRLQEVEKKIQTINKRAEKRGLEKFSLKVGEIFIYKYKDMEGVEIRVEKVKIEIDGELPKIPGYKLLGVKQIIDNITMYTGDFPQEFKNSNNCDHCNTKRQRTFIAAVEKEGKTLLIGSTCFKQVFSDITADNILHYGNILKSINEFEGEEEEDTALSFVKSFYTPLCFVSTCISIIDKEGYLSKAKAEENEGIPTYAIASEYYLHYEDRHLEKAKLVLEYFANLETENSLELNIKNILIERCITSKHIGLTAYAYVAYTRFLEKEQKKAGFVDEAHKSEYISSVKKRQDFRLELVGVTNFEGEWGTTYFYTFKSGDNFVTWKASNAISWQQKVKKIDDDGEWNEIICHYAEKGDMIVLKGTVKEHKTYESERVSKRKITYITRCKLQSVTREGVKLL